MVLTRTCTSAVSDGVSPTEVCAPCNAASSGQQGQERRGGVCHPSIPELAQSHKLCPALAFPLQWVVGMCTDSSPNCQRADFLPLLHFLGGVRWPKKAF